MYLKVLSKFATGKGLRVCVEFEVNQANGISEQSLAETRAALRELGLPDDVETE